MIKVSNVVKSYKNGEVTIQVLKGVTFEVLDNEFVVILGPSGSGKSTLLNSVSGLEGIDSGSIYYDDVDISTLNDKDIVKFRRDNVAFVFQNYYLMNSLTVRANVRMGANLAANTDFDSIIGAVGLKGKEDKYPSQLSGGEMQRVSIARALAKKPKVLFCDEPTGALDEETGKSILRYLIKLQKKEKFTIIMVTHNQNIALLAETVIRMNSGVITSFEKNNPKTVDEIGW